MSDLRENITKIMEITGLNKTLAENILKLNNYNVERAVNYHLEHDIEYAVAGCSSSIINSNQIPTAAPPSSPVDTNSAVSEGASLPDVRAPIPPKREQLLTAEEDNFRFRKRNAQVFKVCPLRNFAREAEIQEQELSWYLENKEGATSSAKLRRNSRRRTKRPRLDDLFCPPIDLLFWGSFNAAREHATAQNRWLIINLQDNSEFKSQILNRDIWPDPELKELIVKYFVLWQVSIDNPEGLRFKAFYHVNKMPYVCIIDPRTGEKRFSCDVVTAQVFRTDLMEFLDTNATSLEPNGLNPYIFGPSTSKAITERSSTITRPACEATSTSSSVTASSPKYDYNQTFELSEEDQLELAIKNSLNETRAVNLHSNGNTSDDLQEISDSENEASTTAEICKEYLEDENDSPTKILLRLSAGERVQMEWKKTTKLRAIRLYIDSKYPEIAKEPYKLISPFPRLNILELDDDLTLEEAKLHPTAVLHIHADD